MYCYMYIRSVRLMVYLYLCVLLRALYIQCLVYCICSCQCICQVNVLSILQYNTRCLLWIYTHSKFIVLMFLLMNCSLVRNNIDSRAGTSSSSIHTFSKQVFPRFPYHRKMDPTIKISIHQNHISEIHLYFYNRQIFYVGTSTRYPLLLLPHFLEILIFIEIFKV